MQSVPLGAGKDDNRDVLQRCAWLPARMPQRDQWAAPCEIRFIRSRRINLAVPMLNQHRVSLPASWQQERQIVFGIVIADGEVDGETEGLFGKIVRVQLRERAWRNDATAQEGGEEHKGDHSSAWFAIALGQPLLKGKNMKSSDGDSGVVIEPHNNAGPGRIDTGVVGSRHGVTFSAARDNREGLERSCSKVLSNIADHA